MVSSSWHDSSVPANHAPPPRGPSNCFKIFPSHSVTLSPTLRPRKSFRCNTYVLPRKYCKQKTYGRTKFFRCNTYKNTGEGSPTLQRGCLSKRALTLSPAPYPLCFHTLAHSPTQQHWHNSFPLNQLRTLFIATEGVPSHRILDLATRRQLSHYASNALFFLTSLPRYPVTCLLRYLSARFARLLLHCSPHGSPTPRPTLPRRSPLARGDCARHSRFAALHCAPRRRRAFFASPDSSGPTLLDRNWFGAW